MAVPVSMVSTATIVHAVLDIQVPIVNTKSINAIQIPVTMEPLVMKMETITHAIALTGTLENNVKNTSIGAVNRHVKMVLHADKLAMLLVAALKAVGLESFVMYKWFPVLMTCVTMDLVKILATHIVAIVAKDIQDLTVKLILTNVNLSRA